MLNKAILMGRLTREPELRTTSSGISVASFTLAISRSYAKDEGQQQADFINCVAWRGTAEFVSKYFTKGMMMVVEGRLQSRSWEDKAGDKRYAMEVVAEQVQFGESKKAESKPEDGGWDAPEGFTAADDLDLPWGV